MNALDRVREKFGNLRPSTDRTDKSPSVGSVGSAPKEAKKFSSLQRSLHRGIRAMAQRWQCTDTELAEMLSRAQRDPAGWMRAVELDERREAEFRKCCLPRRADA